MHAKFLAFLTVSSVALAQVDDYSDYINGLMSMTDDSNIASLTDDMSSYLTNLPTDYSDLFTDYMTDLPTDYSDYSDYSDYMTDLPTATTSFGSNPTGFSSSSGSDSSGSFDDLSNIPDSVIEAIQSVVPTSYIQQLLDPTSRASIINDMKNGEYPSWYNNLPSDVQEWIQNNMVGGTGGTALPTSIPTGSSSAGSSNSGLHSGDVPDAASALSSSIIGSVAAAVGILGLSLVL